MSTVDLKKEFEKRAKKWLMEKHSNWVKNVHFHEHTWETGFEWQQKKEGNIPQASADRVYDEGVSWKIDNVEMTLQPTFVPNETYNKLYDARKGIDIHCNWNRSEMKKVEDSLTVTLNQKLALGSELTANIGFDIVLVGKGQAGLKKTFDIEVSAGQALNYKYTKEVTVGDSIDFDVPKGKAIRLQYLFDEARVDDPFSLTVRASGWFYWTAALRGPYLHYYPCSLDKMPEELRIFRVPGHCNGVLHTNGRLTVTEETGG
jgi:hypothetical protein